MSLIDTYQQLLDSGKLDQDAAQLSALYALDDLTQRLKKKQEQQNSLRYKIVHLYKKRAPIHGLYFYGRVGRGKTMLMNLFYQQLPIKKKIRIHFHRFMESVHQALNELSNNFSLNHLPPANPLIHIAKTWAKQVDVLCFDEFFVSDIGDAMLIAGLLDALFKEGVILIATSNCKPEQLYRNGLQRIRFIPTIALINQHCQVISIDGEADHRLLIIDKKRPRSTSHKTQTPYRYYVFPYQLFPSFLDNIFLSQFTHQLVAGTLTVNNRDVSYLAKTDHAIYFDFYALCAGPRSQRDYIDLANQFTTIFIRYVPQFNGELVPAVFSGIEDSYQRSGVLMGNLMHLDDEARRFIALVDEFYDQHVQLIISAEVDINQLYKGQQLRDEFARCQSRLFEMQSIHY
jgi:cell division protein ZapE